MELGEDQSGHFTMHHGGGAGPHSLKGLFQNWFQCLVSVGLGILVRTQNSVCLQIASPRYHDGVFVALPCLHVIITHVFVSQL